MCSSEKRGASGGMLTGPDLSIYLTLGAHDNPDLAAECVGSRVANVAYSMKKRSPKHSDQIPEWVPFRALRAMTMMAFLGIGFLLFCLVVQPPAVVRDVKTSYDHLVYPDLDPPDLIYSTEKLIGKIQAATRVALEGHPNPTFTEEDRQEWHQTYPCRSRSELQPLYTRRKFVTDVEPNKEWNRVLKEYEKLHRACITKVGKGNLTEYFLSRDNSSGCKFLVGAIQDGAGLGNKVLSMVSGFLYAVLTQRVFVIPADTQVPGIMCEPFEGSSWVVDPEGLFTPWHKHREMWNHSVQFYGEVDSVRKENEVIESWVYGVLPADPPTFSCHPGGRFYCGTEQAYYDAVPWIYFDGCIYFLPKLFTIPSFRPVLEEIFPDRMALTHILRSVMLPSDAVWSRIHQVDMVYLRHADHRVGFQVRYRAGIIQFQKYHDLIEKRVLECAISNGILPQNTSSRQQKTLPAGSYPRRVGRVDNQSWDQSSDPSVPSPSEEVAPTKSSVTTLFIASLFQGLHVYLTEAYVRNPLATGESIGLIQLTHDDTQAFSVEEDLQALTEIIGLSLSDHLFVTPLSTFGGLAQAYGALVPWFIESRLVTEVPCVRAQTSDTCYQLPEQEYSCQYDPNQDGQLVYDIVPYIKNCLSVEVLPMGIQLITGNRTSV